jgi:hypothetical protein
MVFDNTDKSFAVKIAALFVVLILGFMTSKTTSSELKNASQGAVKLEINNASPKLIVNKNDSKQF